MKLRKILFVAIISLLLVACNMNLAQDVTPPPGYVAHTPAPTHGPVFPAQAPDIQNGAAIYAEKCAACHGETGLGDGPQGQQLPVSVPPLAVPELAWKAAPADWFLTVTLGNIDNFMPPFASLNDQERWGVVAYAQSLSSTPEQISQGEQLFNDNCASCPIDFFTNQEKMAALSTDNLVSLLADGGEGLPALGNSFSQEELAAIAAYLRTLTFPASVASTDPALPTESPEPTQTEVPVTEVSVIEAPTTDGTPTEGEQAGPSTEEPAEEAGIGTVSGKLVNGSRGDVPSELTVTLLGFDHAMDAGGTPIEVVNETVETDETGAYLFEEIEISEGRIFLTETTFQGITFQSEMTFSEAGMTELAFPDLMLYESTTENGGLVIEQLHVSFNTADEGGLQIFELFTISNLSDKAYVFTTDGTSLPFIPLPKDAVNIGLELSQDSAPIMTTEDGFAIPPSEDFYSIIAFFSMPYEKELTMSQPLALPVSSMVVIVPEGIKVKASQLIDEGVQETETGHNVRMYSGGSLSAGTAFEIELSGKIKPTASSAIDTDNQQTLLIGAGVFGVVLIMAGIWMFLRDRSVDEDDFEGDENEFETADEVMDAIIALDDLHRAKNIPDETYQKRRAELKDRLKELA